MLDSLLLVPVSIVYLLVIAALCCYGLNFYALTYLSTRSRRAAPPASPPNWPSVTVQLPIYNELYVAKRVIEAAAAMDYPADRLEIQVLDDSTDDTSTVVAQTVREIAAVGTNITHVRRA